jgi:hypothetical protein
VGVFEGGALDGGAAGEADCDHEFVASETASASPASAAAWEAIRILRMTSPPAPFHSRRSQPGWLEFQQLWELSRFAPLFRRYSSLNWQQSRPMFRPQS